MQNAQCKMIFSCCILNFAFCIYFLIGVIDMQFYFAPMEGLTDSIYRRLHHKYFPGVDRYYMPFLSPTIHRTLTHREDRELPM